jgi:hypothetical protein
MYFSINSSLDFILSFSSRPIGLFVFYVHINSQCISGVSVKLTWSDENVMIAWTVQVRTGIARYTKEFFGYSSMTLEGHLCWVLRSLEMG